MILAKHIRGTYDGSFTLFNLSPPSMSKEKHTPAKLIYICTGEKCKKRGSKEISKTLRDITKDYGWDHVGIIRTHCTDNCNHGPVV